MQKLLSVAIPCYNSQEYVRHAIESLLPGKDKIEIIVVNDGSTDDTQKIAEDEFMNCFYNEDFDNYSLYAYWYYL